MLAATHPQRRSDVGGSDRGPRPGPVQIDHLPSPARRGLRTVTALMRCRWRADRISAGPSAPDEKRSSVSCPCSKLRAGGLSYATSRGYKSDRRCRPESTATATLPLTSLCRIISAPADRAAGFHHEIQLAERKGDRGRDLVIAGGDASRPRARFDGKRSSPGGCAPSGIADGPRSAPHALALPAS